MRTHSLAPYCFAIALTPAFSAPLSAQQTEPSASRLETVVVTGSIIAGTPEDAALPVEVLSTDDLKLQGAPSNVDLIKSLPFIGATFAGDANPLGASRVQGASSINLRGLGNARTLVLLNGRRLSPITSGTQTLIDTNSLPMASIERIEVLKDGGAATYGSDAIAGVVNFITDTDYRGLELNATHAFIADSDGDSTASAKWGFGTERIDVLLSAGYQHRSELSLHDRDFAHRPYLENPTGWSTSNNPGIYSIGNSAPTAVSFVDPGCEATGGSLTPLPSVGAARNCLQHYTGWENLVDEQDAFQLFGQLNAAIGESSSFHIDAMYSQIDVDEVDTASSSTILNPPSVASTGGPGPGIIPGRFFIPASNPGLQDLLSRYSAAQLGLSSAQYATAQGAGVNAFGSWRPFAEGGNPAYGGESKHDRRNFTFYRVSAGFSGEQLFGADLSWDVNSTFSSADAEATGADIIVGRLQYALRGLGGPGCTPGGANAATSTPGVGPCQYFNPFSTGIERNALSGVANAGFVGRANSAELARWMFNDGGSTVLNETLTFEGVVSGKLPWLALPGGQIGWGLGAQYRNTATLVEAPDLSNFNLNPCTDEGMPLSNCANDPRGVGGIFGSVVPRDYDQSVKGVYGELGLPILDSLDLQLAVRTEWHDAGDTTNPRASIRWEIVEGLALRASAQSTYRAPPLAFLDPNIATTISQQIGAVRIPFDSTGNADLKPETSDNYNVGLIFDFGGFSATLDYWQFKLEDQLVLEDSTAIVNAMFPTPTTNNCGNPAYADLQARFSFTNAGCSNVANIARVNRRYTNGAPVDASGIDLSTRYVLPLGGGDLSIGVDATYNLDYEVGAVTQFGLRLAEPYDAVGKLNVNIDPRALPQWRGQLLANYAIGAHNVRWVFRYIGDMLDQRAGGGGVNDPLNPVAGFPAGTRVTGGVNIAAYKTHDLFYTWDVLDKTTVSLSVVNALDEDPPLTRNEYSYDPFTASPLGRVFKVGFRQAF
jgi:iron complex outermembrane receptor protein